MERVGSMVRLELSDEEAAVLLEVLEDCVSDLRMEVSNTDNMTFREALKAKGVVLNGVIARLK